MDSIKQRRLKKIKFNKNDIQLELAKIHILMCTNGKKTAEEAIEFGCNLFQKANINATVLYVKPKGSPEGRQFFKRAEEIASRYGLKVKAKTRFGEPSIEIVRESKKGKYNLVVTGYKEIPEELKTLNDIFTSRIIDDITQGIETSMLVVKSPKPVKKVLICTDGSKSAEKAITLFGYLKRGKRIKVDVVNVIPGVYHRFKDLLEPVTEKHLKIFAKLPGERTKNLYRAKELLAKEGIEASIILKEGQAAEEIARLSEQGYDLIVMGFRGLKAREKKTMGRQTRKVIKKSPVSVLAIN